MKIHKISQRDFNKTFDEMGRFLTQTGYQTIGKKKKKMIYDNLKGNLKVCHATLHLWVNHL